MGGIICLLLVGIMVFGLGAFVIGYYIPGATSGSRTKHKASHPGLMKNGKDVICPKCKSPYCQYFYEERLMSPDRAYTKTETHLLNPTKPFIEQKTTMLPGQKFQLKRFRCTKCGYIFD